MSTKFQELAAQKPEAAALLQTVVTTAVQDVEHHHGDLPGAEKKRLAEQQAIELLQKAYDVADLWFGFPSLADYVAKELLIPLIPAAIDGIVQMFNGTGFFTHQAQGVA